MIQQTRSSTDIRDETARVEGLEVRFQRAGFGPPLILLHGLMGYSFSFRRVLPLLSIGREVIAPDMPGSGLSDCSGSLDCRLRCTAGRLLAFMDAVGISSCDLVGSSYGGTTALMAAALAPSRIRTLILVAPANPWSKIGRKRLAILKVPIMGALFPLCARRFRGAHGYFVRRMYGDSTLVTPETLQGYGVPLRRPGVFEHAVRITRSWKSDMQELQAALPKISHIPALILWGTKDRLVEPATAKLIEKSFQNAELAVVDGWGHLPYEEYPADFSRRVLDFLDRHSPTTAQHGK